VYSNVNKSSCVNNIAQLWQNTLGHSSFLCDQGIVRRLICPPTHHQNGIVEHKHKHIVELGLILLHHAFLPLQFWDYAFVTAFYLINRLPMSSLNFSVPYSVLFHKSLDFHFLKTFGCSYFPLL